MRQTFLILLLGIFLVGCSTARKITYNTQDLQTSRSSVPILVDVRILEDARMQNAENDILFVGDMQARVNGKTLCINSENRYKKDSVSSQVAQMIAKHFSQLNLFSQTTFNNPASDYYLTGKLSSFYGEQLFSAAALVGAQFGLLGALATAGAKTEGTIKIEIKNLKLFKKDGTLVKSLGDFSRVYEDKFPADAYCWCIYDNINLKLKEYNSELAEKLLLELSGVDFGI